MPPLDFEKIKAEGLEVDFLKYTQEGFEAIKPDDRYRLKTYGYCAQRHEGYFMLRIRIPGGVIRVDQMERIASLAERCGHGSVHLTTRGNLELHSVKINDYFAIRDELAEVGITTRSSCGHTFRNILGCHKNGVCPEQIFDLTPWIQKVHDHVFEKADFYNHRLPRRLNVSFSGCAGCSADAHINDIGFIAKKACPVRPGGGHADMPEEGLCPAASESHQGGEGSNGVYGFELWVAGSLGTAPRLAHRLKEFIHFEEVLPSLEAITELYCLHGERKNPAKARLKFLIESWGFEKFSAEFEKLLSEFKVKQAPLPPELAAPALLQETSQSLKAALAEGIYPQRQEGFYRVEFWVPLGEMSAGQLKAIAELSRKFADAKVYHTTRQNFEFHWVKKEDLRSLLEGMAQVGFRPENSESILNVVACPGTSFCSLAVTSSQGAAAVLMKEFRSLSFERDPALQNLKINISGCPNSCAKHQVADIGFSGGMTEIGGIRRFGYQLYVGGKFNGEVRAGVQIKKGIPDDLVFPTAESVLELFKEGKLLEETFPDFVDRTGVETLSRLLEEKLATKRPNPMESPIVMFARTIRSDRPDQAADGGLSEPARSTRSDRPDQAADGGLSEPARTIQADPGSGGSMVIGTVKEWEERPAKIVTRGGEAIAVFKTPSGFRACQNTCPHAGGSLVAGSVEGETVTCPLHRWLFDLKTGACLNEPGNDIRVYTVETRDGNVYLNS